jgi:hypothetical protein
MRVLVFCLIASLAIPAAAQTGKPLPRPASPAARSSAPARAASTTPAHFTAAGLNDEDDLLRIYSGDFQSIHLDHDGSQFMLIIDGYMTDFGNECKRFLPPNKVEITRQVCNDSPTTPVASPDGVHDYYGNLLPQSTGCSSYHTEGTGVFADPQLYDAVKDVSAKAQVHLVQNMLGVATGKGGRAANPFTISQQITDQLVAVGTEMKTVIHTNGCGSPGLINFQSNLIRFANGETPVKYAGAVVAARIAGNPSKDTDFTRLVDDLVTDSAHSWVMNRYQPGSISDPIVSHDPGGDPVRILARFRYAGQSQGGRVTVSFKDGAPDCLYFSDAPDNCRAASQRVISAYEKNAYAKFGGASPKGPFADGCNAFMRAPRTSRFAPSDPEGYCQCLSNGYQKVMTPAEQVLYGQNFEEKFWRGIAQPTSNDPAWPRLNPVAVSCMQ